MKIGFPIWIIMVALAILAVLTFAQIRAFDSSFKAFTVWLFAFGFVTFAAFVMGTVVGHFWFECVWIWSEYSYYGFFATFLMLLFCGVLADGLLACTVWPTRCIVHQADAIELQAFVFLAGASFACSCFSSCLHEFFMRDACLDDFFSDRLSSLPLLLLDQVLFFLGGRLRIREQAALSAWCLHQGWIPKFWCGVATVWLVILEFYLSDLLHFGKVYLSSERILKLELPLIFDHLLRWVTWRGKNIVLGAIFFFDVCLCWSTQRLFHRGKTDFYGIRFFEWFSIISILKQNLIFLQNFLSFSFILRFWGFRIWVFVLVKVHSKTPFLQHWFFIGIANFAQNVFWHQHIIVFWHLWFSRRLKHFWLTAEERLLWHIMLELGETWIHHAMLMMVLKALEILHLVIIIHKRRLFKLVPHLVVELWNRHVFDFATGAFYFAAFFMVIWSHNVWVKWINDEDTTFWN